MAITNYSELQAAVGNWLDRSDLTSRIPEFIALAESYMSDDLRLRSMISEATLNPSQSEKTLALPTGFKEPIAFINNQGEAVQQLHHEDLLELQYSAPSGRPQFYSITSQINFECVAGGSYDYTMTYYKALDIATDETNDVLTNYPNLYLYGSLVQAEPYLKNDVRIDTWHQLYNVALKRANNKAQQSLKKLRTDHPAISGGFDINRGY